MKKIIFTVFLFLLVFPSVHAQEVLPDRVSTVKAKVFSVESQEVRDIPGTNVSHTYQDIRAEILEGAHIGEVVTVMNDYLTLEKGEIFYLLVTEHGTGALTTYAVSDPYRLPVVFISVILFLVLVIVFGGIQGIRGLLSLIGSLALIAYLLLPGILHGYSPIVIAVSVSALIVIVGSYITHGFNKTTTSAVIGMIITVIITGWLAQLFVSAARLSGFADEAAVYLNIDTSGAIDFVGLLMAGILIGLLGILYDVAIGQAIAVEELRTVAPHLPRRTIYKRAIRMGREHIGALVNTLAIAYVGVSLPLILLYMKSAQSSLGMIVNREIFATEIIRTMIGSSGLVLAVPITTAIAVWVLMKKQETVSVEEQKKEEKALAGVHHTHIG